MQNQKSEITNPASHDLCINQNESCWVIGNLTHKDQTKKIIAIPEVVTKIDKNLIHICFLLIPEPTEANVFLVSKWLHFVFNPGSCKRNLSGNKLTAKECSIFIEFMTYLTQKAKENLQSQNFSRMLQQF